MRTCKKIIFVILALLPVLSVLFSFISAIGNDVQAAYIPLGTVELVENENNFFDLIAEENSWSDRILTPLGLTRQHNDTNIMSAGNELLAIFEEACGFPCSLPLVLAYWYFIYLFFVFMLDIIVDLISFIPRKIEVMLQ